MSQCAASLEEGGSGKKLHNKNVEGHIASHKKCIYFLG